MGFIAADMQAVRDRQRSTELSDKRTQTAARKPVPKVTELGDKRIQAAAQKPVKPVTKPPVLTPAAFDHSQAGRDIIATAGANATYDTGTVVSGPTAPRPKAPATVPPATTASVDAGEQAEIDKARADADATLQAQLDAIAAQYGLTREQLDAEGGEVGRQWEIAKTDLIRQAFEQQEATINNMIERGIIKSGITVQETLRNERAEERGVGILDKDKAVSLADIAARRAAIGPQEAADKATATANHEAALRDLELMQAAYGQPSEQPTVPAGTSTAAKTEEKPAPLTDFSNIKKSRHVATRY